MSLSPDYTSLLKLRHDGVQLVFPFSLIRVFCDRGLYDGDLYDRGDRDGGLHDGGLWGGGDRDGGLHDGGLWGGGDLYDGGLYDDDLYDDDL